MAVDDKCICVLREYNGLLAHSVCTCIAENVLWMTELLDSVAFSISRLAAETESLWAAPPALHPAADVHDTDEYKTAVCVCSQWCDFWFSALALSRTGISIAGRHCSGGQEGCCWCTVLICIRRRVVCSAHLAESPAVYADCTSAACCLSVMQYCKRCQPVRLACWHAATGRLCQLVASPRGSLKLQPVSTCTQLITKHVTWHLDVVFIIPLPGLQTGCRLTWGLLIQRVRVEITSRGLNYCSVSVGTRTGVYRHTHGCMLYQKSLKRTKINAALAETLIYCWKIIITRSNLSLLECTKIVCGWALQHVLRLTSFTHHGVERAGR